MKLSVSPVRMRTIRALRKRLSELREEIEQDDVAHEAVESLAEVFLEHVGQDISGSVIHLDPETLSLQIVVTLHSRDEFAEAVAKYAYRDELEFQFNSETPVQ